MTQPPKPELYGSDYAEWFKDVDVVAAYPSRPVYAQAAIELLSQLAVDEPRQVLDVGCGNGDVARRLAPLVDRVDAVDFSDAMVETGRRLPGGDAPNLRWTVGAAEEVDLSGPYALVTAGESLHWMDWPIVMRRFADVLLPHGVVALLYRNFEGSPAVRERILPLLKRYSAVRVWQTVSLLDELTGRGLFRIDGEQQFVETWRPTIAEYLECRHSQRGFARAAMGAESVAAFDAEMTLALEELCAEGTLETLDGRLRIDAVTAVTWGTPLRAA